LSSGKRNKTLDYESMSTFTSNLLRRFKEK
jgi:hypothetical protein